MSIYKEKRRFLSMKGLWVLSFVLYLLGLFEDSYYGIIEGILVISNLYERLFSLFDYSGNGFFNAPIFLVVGMWIGQHKENLVARKEAIIKCLLFFILITIEGLVLREFQLQRQDSMYLMLVPCMFYLMQFLLSIKLPSVIVVRELLTLIYIFHPLAIIFVRRIAKFINDESILLEESLLHYVVVCRLCGFLVMPYCIRKRIKSHNNHNVMETKE